MKSMSQAKIQIYLSDALDQEACRATLLAALQSRVASLQHSGIPDAIIMDCLECLHDEPYQMNNDVILEVMELILIGSTFNPV